VPAAVRSVATHRRAYCHRWAPLQLWRCHGYAYNGAPQRWQFVNLGASQYNGRTNYQIRNTGNNLCLLLANGSGAPGTRIAQGSCSSGAYTVWQILDQSTGNITNGSPYQFELRNAWFPLCMAAANNFGLQRHGIDHGGLHGGRRADQHFRTRLTLTTGRRRPTSLIDGCRQADLSSPRCRTGPMTVHCQPSPPDLSGARPRPSIGFSKHAYFDGMAGRTSTVHIRLRRPPQKIARFAVCQACEGFSVLWVPIERSTRDIDWSRFSVLRSSSIREGSADDSAPLSMTWADAGDVKGGGVKLGMNQAGRPCVLSGWIPLVEKHRGR
jgi:hypothetical protein